MNTITCSLLFAIFAQAYGGFCAEPSDATLIAATKYGIAWDFYWNVVHEEMDGGKITKKNPILSVVEHPVQVTVWAAPVRMASSDRAYFIESLVPTNSTEYIPHLVIYCKERHVTAIDFGMRETNAVLTRKALKIDLSEGFDNEAARFSAKGLESLTNLELGLKGMLHQKNVKTLQHFFVGPFAEYSPKVVILWVERKTFIETEPPVSDSVKMLTAQLLEARFSTVDNLGDEEKKHDAGGGVSSERRWIQKWVTNCVFDGKLLEVRAAN